MSQYKNLRHFIYLNVPAQHRSEGYRLARKLVEQVKNDSADIAAVATKEAHGDDCMCDQCILCQEIAERIMSS